MLSVLSVFCIVLWIFFVKRMKLCVPRALFAGAPEAIGECLAGWGQGWSTGIGILAS